MPGVRRTASRAAAQARRRSSSTAASPPSSSFQHKVRTPDTTDVETGTTEDFSLQFLANEEVKKMSEMIILDVHETRKILTKRHTEKQAILSIASYTLFIILYFSAVIAQFRTTDSFKLERAMTDYLVGGDVAIDDTKTLSDIWTFLEDGLIAGLFPAEQWYNGQAYTDDEKGFILNYNKLVGGFSLIQQRVDTNVSCVYSERFSTFVPVCWQALDKTTISSKPYGPAFNPTMYQPDEGTNDFRITFPLDADLSTNMIKELKSNLWLDKNTRHLTVEFVIFNSAKQIFCLVRIVFEHLETGMIDSAYKFTTFALEPYLDRSPGLESCIVLFGIYYAFHFVQDIAKNVKGGGLRGCLSELCKFSNIFEGVRLVLLWNIGSMWLNLVNHPQNSNLVLPVPKQQEVQLSQFADDYSAYQSYHATFTLMCLVRLLYFLSHLEMAGMVVHCMFHSWPMLLMWGVIFAISFTFFGVIAMMMFGSSIVNFSTISLAMLEIVKMSFEIGLELSELEEIDPKQAIIFYAAFMIVSTLLLLNIFIAILMDSYAEINQNRAKHSDKREAQETSMSNHIRAMSKILLRIMAEARLVVSQRMKKGSKDCVVAAKIAREAVIVGCMVMNGKGSQAEEDLIAHWDTDGDGTLDLVEIDGGLKSVMMYVQSRCNHLDSLRIGPSFQLEIAMETAVWFSDLFGLPDSWIKQQIRSYPGFLGTVEGFKILDRLQTIKEREQEALREADLTKNGDVEVRKPSSVAQRLIGMMLEDKGKEGEFVLDWDDILVEEGYDVATMLVLRYGTVKEESEELEPDLPTDNEKMEEVLTSVLSMQENLLAMDGQALSELKLEQMKSLAADLMRIALTLTQGPAAGGAEKFDATKRALARTDINSLLGGLSMVRDLNSHSTVLDF